MTTRTLTVDQYAAMPVKRQQAIDAWLKAHGCERHGVYAIDIRSDGNVTVHSYRLDGAGRPYLDVRANDVTRDHRTFIPTYPFPTEDA